MRNRSWPLQALAFGSLLLLLALSGAALYRYVSKIYAEVAEIQESFKESERGLNDLRAHIYSLAVLVRDYLLESSQATEPDQRQQLIQLHASIVTELDALQTSMGREQSAALLHLRQGVDKYWDTIDAILAWTPAQKAARSPAFLRHHVVPYRTAVLSIANEIGALNSYNLQRRQDLIRQTLYDVRRYLTGVIAAAIALGILIAGSSIARVSVLESRAEQHRRQIEHDRQELRSLSQKLVKAQEEERKSISRELHDQVGQMLTALGMEVGNLEELRDTPGDEYQEHLRGARTLVEQTLRSVRDIAMGLRPSMLDDLGLASALKWQAREFTRHSGIPVDVQIEGNLDHLPEGHRTCVYRVVQEALTNSARHAEAKNIRITVHGRNDEISLTVQDDGVGFDSRKVGERGLGLLGIEERVRELRGKVAIFSQPEKGVLLRVEIPSTREVSA